MRNNLVKKTINFIKTETRFFLAGMFLGMAFVINYGLYANHKKTTESCVDGKCLSDFSGKLLSEEAIISETEASQLVSNDAFSSLKESRVALGQVFQAKEAMIAGVALKIDINKNFNPGSRQYVLSLREVEYDGEKIFISGPIISDLAFSVGSIEKYREADGSFLFPLFGILKKDKYYLISLDNSKVDVGKQNYLEPLGSAESKSYPAGSVVVKKNKEVSLISGDLYFKVFGAKLSFEQGEKILNGVKMEDLGNGMGKYSYATKGKFVDLFDLETASPGTEFSENDKVIYAPAKDSAGFSYVVNTLHPISKMNFSATQIRAGWRKVRVSYSFDQSNWFDLPSSEKAETVTNASVDPLADPSVLTENTNGDNTDSTINDLSDINQAIKQEMVQVFNADIVPAKEAQTIYFKISYDPNDASTGKFFALKNLKITADLKIK